MNIKLDSKTLLEDNAQLWQYRLQSFKSGDTQLVRLESKLQFRNSKNYVRIRIDLEFNLVGQKLRTLDSFSYLRVAEKPKARFLDHKSYKRYVDQYFLSKFFRANGLAFKGFQKNDPYLLLMNTS